MSSLLDRVASNYAAPLERGEPEKQNQDQGSLPDIMFDAVDEALGYVGRTGSQSGRQITCDPVADGVCETAGPVVSEAAADGISEVAAQGIGEVVAQGVGEAAAQGAGEGIMHVLGAILEGISV